MSQVQQIAVRLVAVGPGGPRHRAQAWQRRVPIVLAWSATLAALGALLVFATLAVEVA